MMKILCGTDLSATSGDALDVARALAAQAGATEVILLHVADPAGNEVTRDDALDQARTTLDELAASRAGSPTVHSEMLMGEPDETLVSYAETEHVDLIVIAHSASGRRLGSTAAKIISRTSIPVVCVRDPAPWLAFARGERPLRVMLGIDDSAVCALGMQWIHALRQRGALETTLGAIYYPDEAADRYGLQIKSAVDHDPEIEKLLTRDLLRRFNVPGATDVHARARRGLGRLGDHLIELANDEAVEVIVVGTGQKTGIGRLGSVSSVIIADAPQSVVCVPPNASIPTIVVPTIRSVLVATDLSQFANRAVAHAFAIARDEVHIVHVLDSDSKANEAETARVVRSLAPVGASQRVHAHIVRGGDPAITLARAAALHGVDLICISSHGRSGIARALVGSVADKLLRATRLPVLVLRPA